MGIDRIALVCMTPKADASELGDIELPSYGVRRVLAALMADPNLNDTKVALIDCERVDVDAYVDAIDSFEPDLIGISIYVWSTPCLTEVARRIKRRRPECTIVFGGPSARTALFDLPPYREAHTYVDAVVASEGEITFREIARLPQLSRPALESVGGLDLPDSNGWTRTGPRTSVDRLDDIVSPFQLKLMGKNSVAYLETFRGCPLSCTFCEWGAGDSTATIFSKDYLVRELESYQQLGVPAVFLVDAGLNLNHRAFRNLCEAEARVGFMRTTQLWCEIYPSFAKEEHLRFLSSVKTSYLGIGLQSIDPEVLRQHERPFDMRRFEPVVRQLCEVAHAEIQVIFGLPGDSPEGFRQTLAYARSFPAAVRAYHCLVLPDALMTRGRPEWELNYDPLTLEMHACLGWSHDDVLEMRADLTTESQRSGGAAGNYWWFFPRQV